jgi:hypothetical protein
MRPQIFLRTFLVLLSMPIGTKAVPQSSTSRRVTKTAPTIPSKRTGPIDAMSFFEPGTSHWKPALTLGPFGLWPQGTVVFRPGGPGEIFPDDSLSMKFGRTRGEGLRGKLKIHGRRLDAPAPPLRARIPDGYGDTGFQATALIFPTEGCWEVAGEVGDTRLAFVTQVVRVREHN